MNQAAVTVDSCTNLSALDNHSQTTSQGEYVPDVIFKHVVKVLQLYCFPVVVVLGICGNTVSAVVFLSTRLRRLSSAIYLLVLALSDSFFLLTNFLIWLTSLDVNVVNVNGVCQLTVYFNHVSSCLSAWLVVGFTVERYIAICHPLKRPEMCTVFRAKIVTASLTLGSALLYCYQLWSTHLSNVNGPMCVTVGRHVEVVAAMGNVDVVVTLIVPVCTIFWLNITMLIQICGIYKTSNEIRATQQNNETTRNKAQVKITKLLIIVSTVFLLLNSPSGVLRVKWFAQRLLNSEYVPSGPEKMLQQLFQFLFTVNFAINFVLYSLCGNNFRKSLRSLCGFKIIPRRHVSKYSMKYSSAYETNTMCDSV